MQVNKRSGESIDNDSKRAKHSIDVEDAALKYQNSNDEASNTAKELTNIDEANDDVETNIDSELLSHQAQSYVENHEDNTQNYLNSVGENTSQEDLGNEEKQNNEHVNDQNEGHNEESTASQAIHRSSQQILHQSNGKPLAGTEEWHRIRKDNHKEVERRRRENINSGIKELATLLPAPETNKAHILQRAIEYIKRLKENENNNIEKWTLEKLLTDQAVAELTASNEKLKAELERAYREVEHWKKACSVTKEEK